MARHKIPLKDKEIVKRRLAEGKSYREAIKGTAIKSHRTAGNIAKRELHDIVQLREHYLKLIESFNAGEIDRARLWAEMTRATKTVSAQILVKEEGGVLKKEDEGIIEVPDWTNRGVGLKYIDSLANLKPQEEEKPPIAIQINFGVNNLTNKDLLKTHDEWST